MQFVTPATRCGTCSILFVIRYISSVLDTRGSSVGLALGLGRASLAPIVRASLFINLECSMSLYVIWRGGSYSIYSIHRSFALLPLSYDCAGYTTPTSDLSGRGGIPCQGDALHLFLEETMDMTEDYLPSSTILLARCLYDIFVS